MSSSCGVCLFSAGVRGRAHVSENHEYLREVIEHLGLSVKWCEESELATELTSLSLLITVGSADVRAGVPQSERTWAKDMEAATQPAPVNSLPDRIRAWVQAGGCWISIASVCNMPEFFGVQPEAPAYEPFAPYRVRSLGEGYVVASSPNAAVAGMSLELPLHFFGGLSVRAAGAQVLASVLDKHQRPTPYVGISRRDVGNGTCIFIGPDFTGTLVRVQQGICVTRDGVAAPDGTAPVTDGILKCDDGHVLDYDFDRQDVPKIPGYRAFLQPVADRWRELFLRCLLDLAEKHQIDLALLWYYPRNLPALGHLSHDSDGNIPRQALALLESMAEVNARGTWAVIEPGYEPEMVERIRAAGHELGMHYNALGPGSWNAEEFQRQNHFLKKQFGHAPLSNKNHYTVWEGDCEFFRWCVANGVQIESSKGGSKSGNAGLTFGTCHPFFPFDEQGKKLDVIELPYLTTDWEISIPSILGMTLMETAHRFHGIAHYVFHPGLSDRPEVAEAMKTAVRRGRSLGMEWWTAVEINAWERARRRVKITVNQAQFTLQSDDDLNDATILIKSHDAQRKYQLDGQTISHQTIERWGVAFDVITLNLRAGKNHLLTVSNHAMSLSQ